MLDIIGEIRKLRLKMKKLPKGMVREGLLSEGSGRIRFQREDCDATVHVHGDRIRYEDVAAWRRLQMLKGEPGSFEWRWDTTKAKQERAWAFGAIRPGERLLDVGFRDGYNLRELIDRGVNAMGVEVNPNAVEHAAGLGVHAIVGDVQAGLPLGDGLFDVVMALDVLEHCFDPEAACREILRLLAPGGRAVIQIPFEGRFEFSNLKHGHAALFHDDATATAVFESAGFRVEDRNLEQREHNLFLLRASAAGGGTSDAAA